MMLGKCFLQIIALLLQFTILPYLLHSVDSFGVKTSNSILHQSNPSFLSIRPAYRCFISPHHEKITRTGSSIFRCYGFYHPQSLRQQRQSEHKASREKFVINEDITFKQIRVIIPSIIDDTPDESLGVITREEALTAAKQRNSDLVLINGKANPPVCKIVDFGKFKYNQAKKKRDQQKTSHKSQADMKEIKLSYKIDTHDIQFKQKSALGFLQEGDRVKVTLNLKGREMQFQDNENTATILTDFVSKLLPYAKIEEQIQTEGRSMFLILNPKKPDKKGGGGSSNKPQVDPTIADTAVSSPTTMPISVIPVDHVNHGT